MLETDIYTPSTGCRTQHPKLFEKSSHLNLFLGIFYIIFFIFYHARKAQALCLSSFRDIKILYGQKSKIIWKKFLSPAGIAIPTRINFTPYTYEKFRFNQDCHETIKKLLFLPLETFRSLSHFSSTEKKLTTN